MKKKASDKHHKEHFLLPERAMLGTSWIYMRVLYLHQVQQNYRLSVYSTARCHVPFTVVKHRTTTNYKGHIIPACVNTAEPCLCLRGLDNHLSLQHRTLKSRCGVFPLFTQCLLHSHFSKNTNIPFWLERRHVLWQKFFLHFFLFDNIYNKVQLY